MVYEYEAELDEIDEEREHAAKAAADAAALSSSTDAAPAAATNNLTTLDDKSLSSAPRSLANVIKSYTGAGVLGLPYAFSLAGYGVGIPVFIVIGLLALHCTVRIEPHDRIFTITLLEFSSWLTRVRDGAAIDTMQLLLVRCKRVVLKENNKKHNIEHQEHRLVTFAEVGQFFLGSKGRIAVDVGLISSQVGFCCVYFIFLGTNLQSTMKSHFSIDLGEIAWMAICAPPLILICMLRSLRRLAPFSMLSLTLFIYSFLVVVVYGALSPLFAKDDVRAAPNDWGSFPIFIAMSIYAFEGIGLVLPLENAARNKQGFPLLYSTGLGMVATLNTAFGIFGYISFGAAIETVALLNVPENAIPAIIAQVGVIIATVCAYPLMMWPVIERIEPIIFGPDTQYVETKRNLFRMGLVLLSFGLAASIPMFDLFTSLVGAICSTALAFILPGLFHYQMMHTNPNANKDTWEFKLHSWKDLVLVVLGVIASIVCTAITVLQIVWRFQEQYSGDNSAPPPSTMMNMTAAAAF